MRLFVREPLVHFMVLGLVIWLGVGYWATTNSRYTIVVGRAQREQIVSNYERQFGRPPSAAQLRALVDQYVHEEILLREGLALHLDKDDEIVRRRIMQKYEFLQADLAAPEAPESGALEHWFEQNRAQYLNPERLTFSHIYFSTDKDGEIASELRASRALEALRGFKVTRPRNLGDPFPGPSDLSALTPNEIKRLFGESEVSQKIFNVPLETWVGPFRSGFGWHLVYVIGREPAAVPPFTEIRPRVLADYMDKQRRAQNTHAFERLRAKYTIRDNGTAQ